MCVKVGCTFSKDLEAGGATPFFSAVHTPFGPRKSETPALVEIPAPVSTTQLFDLRIMSASLSIFLLTTVGSSSFSGRPNPGALGVLRARGRKKRARGTTAQHAQNTMVDSMRAACAACAARRRAQRTSTLFHPRCEPARIAACAVVDALVGFLPILARPAARRHGLRVRDTLTRELQKRLPLSLLP